MGKKTELAVLLATVLAAKGGFEENRSRDLQQHSACVTYAEELGAQTTIQAERTIRTEIGEAVVIPYEFDTSGLSFLGRTWLMASDKLIDTLVEQPVQNAICDKSAYDIA